MLRLTRETQHAQNTSASARSVRPRRHGRPGGAPRGDGAGPRVAPRRRHRPGHPGPTTDRRGELRRRRAGPPARHPRRGATPGRRRRRRASPSPGARGVPADATAVALNVTVTDTTAPGFVTRLARRPGPARGLEPERRAGRPDRPEPGDRAARRRRRGRRLHPVGHRSRGRRRRRLAAGGHGDGGAARCHRPDARARHPHAAHRWPPARPRSSTSVRPPPTRRAPS